MRSIAIRPSGCALVGVILLLLCATRSIAEPRFTLRMATPAPDGTAWAREMRALARDVERDTHGDVFIKWYFGGIVTDELALSQRVRRGQLDGIGSGGALCSQLAPSIQVLSIPGLFRSRAESSYIARKLHPTLEAEYGRAGFVSFGLVGLGPALIFSREPVRSMADLRRTTLWTWDVHVVESAVLRQLGVRVVPLPLEDAAKAYDERRVDGFFAVPLAALSFQWSAQTRYFTDLGMAYPTSCWLIAQASFDALPIEHQRAVRNAFLGAIDRGEASLVAQETALVDSLFSQQGLKTIRVSDAFRVQFFADARNAWSALDEHLIPNALLTRVIGWLSELRAKIDAPAP